jgi:hypothetical protein
MDSKKASRRKFLKGGAAAAAVGAIQSASGQAQVPAKRSLKDEVAYGERSHYVNSVRIAVAERPSPDEFGLTFHVLTPLQDSVGLSRLPRSTLWAPIVAPLFRTSIPGSIAFCCTAW